MELDALDLKAHPGAFSTYDMEICVPEIAKLEPGQVYMEIGVDRGKSLSVARMVAKKGVSVWGVDLRQDPMVDGANFIQGNSQEVAKNWGKKIDVLFIDADHTYEGCKADIDSWYPHMKPNGVMLFHDCDASSPGVEKAVAEFAEGKDLYISPNQKCSMARVRL